MSNVPRTLRSLGRRKALSQIVSLPFLAGPVRAISRTRGRVIEIGPTEVHGTSEAVTSALQNLLDDRSIATLYVKRGVYRISRSLIVSHGVELNLDADAVIDGSGIPPGPALGSTAIVEVQGTIAARLRHQSEVLGDTDYLSVNEQQHAWRRGDLFIIAADLPFLEMQEGQTTASKLGFMHRVSHQTGPILHLEDKHPYGMPNFGSIEIAPLRPVIGFRIRGGVIIGGGKGHCHTGIRLRYCADAVVDNLRIDGCEDMGINIGGSYEVSVARSIVRNATSPGLPKGNTGYGVAAMDGARRIRILDGEFHNCRHAVAGGGRFWSANVLVARNRATKCGLGTPAFDCHEPSHAWRFERNSVMGGDGGFVIRGQSIELVQNKVENTRGVGIRIRSYVRTKRGITNVAVISNCVHRTGGRGISIEGSDAPLEDVRVELNRVRDATDAGVYADPGDNMVISGNNVIGGRGRNFQAFVVPPTLQRSVGQENTVSTDADVQRKTCP